MSDCIGSLKFESGEGEEKLDTSHHAPLLLHILNTVTTNPVDLGYDAEFNTLLDSISRETIADWVHKKKIADKILRLKLRLRNNNFLNIVLEEIFKSFLSGKPVVTPIEVARFLEK